MSSPKEKDYKSKSNNNFNLNEKNSQQPEGLNHYKHCLPSFLLDEYFKQNSDCENDSSDDKDDKKNNSFDKTNEDKNISKNLLEEEKTEENSNHLNLSNTKEELKNNSQKIDNNILNKKNIINNDINKINNINNITNTTSGNNSSKNMHKFFPNSFNNKNTSTYYYQNYLNSINNMHSLEPNYNILNNNINIINNNNFMDGNNTPYYLNNINNINNNINANNYPNQTFSFNQPMSKKYFNQSMKEINHINFSNNFPFNGDLTNKKNKIFESKLSFPLSPPLRMGGSNNEIRQEKHKKNNKKNKKEKQDENSIIKKMLNMSDYSLSNFLKNQKDSRDAQNALTNMKEKEVDLLINKLKNFISDVTLDKYGNYFTQKLIQICVPSQRLKLIQNLEGHFIEIANNTFGTHPLQSLMEIINMPEEKKLILKYILGNETVLSFDVKGTHILQKYICNTKDEDRYELNINIINLIDKLIVDISGVCVLIKLIKHTKDKIILEKVAKYITTNEPLFFIQHPYANYAVQSLIMNPLALPYCEKIIETIVNNYLSLSMQKFSSNVVENCIKYADENSVKKIYNAIIDQEKIESLLNNNYGNYVLEKLIERINQEDKIKLAKKIEKYGKNKILSNCLKSIIN